MHQTLERTERAQENGPAGRRHGRHPLWHVVRWVLLGCVVVVLGLSSWSVGSYLLRSHPGPMSIRSAVRAFGSAGRDAQVRGQRYLPPLAGVYTLQGSGQEHISFPPNSQVDGRVMPASVHYLSGGCWRWHLDYNVAHWEEYDFCPTHHTLTLAAERNSQSWDFGTTTITNMAQLTCPSVLVLPEAPARGQHEDWVCTGTNTAVAGTTRSATDATIVGVSTLHLAGGPVTAVHQHQVTTLTGSQSGTVVEDWWYDAATGLPLRMVRDINLRTASPIGTITYHEAGEWQMVSTTPTQPKGS